MYIPAPFSQQNDAVLDAFMLEYGFATLISIVDGRPFASHLPMLAQREKRGRRLLCHVARANPHWQALREHPEVLAIFHGPHAYVSPDWYTEEGVPTWNYAVVHAYGRARVIDDGARIWEMLRELTETHEAGRSRPWRPALSPASRERLVSKVVGIVIEVTAVEGKFKLSQNRPAVDRVKVVAQLEASDRDDARELAAFMRRHGDDASE